MFCVYESTPHPGYGLAQMALEDTTTPYYMIETYGLVYVGGRGVPFVDHPNKGWHWDPSKNTDELMGLVSAMKAKLEPHLKKTMLPWARFASDLQMAWWDGTLYEKVCEYFIKYEEYLI